MTKKLNYETSLLEYGEVNSGFAKVKISVLTYEQVANGTKFTKECIDRRASGLNYLPVIGEFKEENNDFGTHGGKIEISDDAFNVIETTKPYGVVIADSYRWENVKLKNGETVPYLVCDCFLWIERYPELNTLYEGKLNNQSMEIKVIDGKFNEDNWVYDVEDFEFSALCLLGKSIRPAFDEARVDVNYQKEDFKLQYEEMVTALNKYLENHQEKEVNEKMTKVEEQFEEVQEIQEVEEVKEQTQEDVEEEFTETEEVVETETETETEETVKTETEETVEEEFTEKEEVVESIDYKELYDSLTVKYEDLLKVIEELKQYKSNREYQDELVVKMSKIDSFKTKLTEEDLLPIVENIDSYTVEQIEDKCFAVLGRKNIETYTKQNVQGSNKTVVLKGLNNNTTNSIWDIL